MGYKYVVVQMWNPFLSSIIIERKKNPTKNFHNCKKHALGSRYVQERAASRDASRKTYHYCLMQSEPLEPEKGGL